MHPHRARRMDAVGTALGLGEPEDDGTEFANDDLGVHCEVHLDDVMEAAVGAPNGVDGC